MWSRLRWLLEAGQYVWAGLVVVVGAYLLIALVVALVTGRWGLDRFACFVCS